MIIGRFADAAGISAVSTGSQVMQAITSLVTGLATGGTVLIGQYVGAAGGKTSARPSVLCSPSLR